MTQLCFDYPYLSSSSGFPRELTSQHDIGLKSGQYLPLLPDQADNV